MNLKYSFLMKCLSVRILLAIISKYIPLDYLPYAGYLALLYFIGFTYIYLSGSRQNKGFVGGKVWWNNYRPLAWCFISFICIICNKKTICLDNITY